MTKARLFGDFRHQNKQEFERGSNTKARKTQSQRDDLETILEFVESRAGSRVIKKKPEQRNVSLRGWPSDLMIAPMVSPTLYPTLSTALKSKFFPPLTVIAAGIGQMMINCAFWKKALSATARRQPQRGGMAFAGRC
ncbi:hypothetical protein [Roseobacter sp. AzwK-3b]|uniref:hypothetical protein n=1 Tax=Roseobacter sp. AzwK-3b TaxID=351016 RepID=UPI001E579C63|nr:hypothetical protein [Roseobacter sp. AzwK-3b]